MLFENWACGQKPFYVLDTTRGTLDYTPIGSETSTIIPFQLSVAEMDAISRTAISIDFFHYPARYVVPDDAYRGVHSPYMTYHLTITYGDLSNSVIWVDDVITDPTYTKADRLRELVNLIESTIESRPEFHALPTPASGCA